MKVPQNLEEWEAMRIERITTEEYAAAEEVAKQTLELVHGYNRGLILADDFVAAVQRTVLL